MDIRRRIVFWAVVAVLVVVGLYALSQVAVNMYGLSQETVAQPSASELKANFESIPNGMGENDVVAKMGANFSVAECQHETAAPLEPLPGAEPQDLPAIPSTDCSHTYHYQSGDQGWDFTFDMDGKLIKKKIAVGEP